MAREVGYVEVNGSSVYYELSGNPEGKPLLMLHGGLGSINDLDPLINCITDDFRVIRLDSRGHGRSSIGHLPLSYALYQQDVLAVLAHLGIQRYSIFGFSDGGIVGYRLASQQGQSVVCLATLGSQWRLEKGDPSIEMLNGLTEEFWSECFPNSIENYNKVNPEPNFRQLINAVKKMWLDTDASGYPGDSVETITCPCLIMRGDNDFLFSIDEALSLNNRLKYVDFANIPFAEHAAHQESTKVVGTILKQFLSNQVLSE